MEYVITFCGPSKDYFNVSSFTIASDIPLNSAELKKRLIETESIVSDACKEAAISIINASAIGTEKQILNETIPLVTSTQLFLLPPVCGG